MSVRLKLTLSYAGFLVVAAAALFAGLLAVLRFVPDENLYVYDGGFAPNRSDLLDVAIPASGAALVFLAVVGLVGGWALSGRMLAPLDSIGRAAALAADGSLTHRVALEGPDDELRRLADAFDVMLGRLQHAFDEQRRFTANASHELRTPHTVTRSLLEVALADREGRDVDRLLTRLYETNERSIELVESLLQLARLDHDELPTESTDLSDVVREAVTMQEIGTTGEALPTATTEAPPDAAHRGTQDAGQEPELAAVLEPAPVQGNHILLVQLVVNLLGNAARHNLPAGGRIEVRTGLDAEARPTLVVENTGAVLDPALVATLTEPFVRGSARTRGRSRPPGSGLGLAIVGSIARAHAADLTLHPRPGGGLVVTVTFGQTSTRPLR
ncbi:HAMP domain-containing histidine kinase [Myceligenerans sp. TRM 65318]|uniref:histidine kinase n=2 Tax=Myceligenerans pegani TaxID=2776917 RepID=A0ABR9N5Z4_9MICO|nr:HAMP domain-containing histidine kinase [Myceligenerans sp. TRM 65318]MBE3020814.1 HAMP domain-containing histidine kinase [Myceligenerans sp. TRM 65318]